ncbi:MAG: hypothetical protein DRI95_10570 [Bacteroidetes bacterium]|nr:MAG: hypothetical protein DRI95_10570 [Bacteroidota bacterium]
MRAFIYTIILGFCTIILSPQLQAKEKARLSVNYNKVMGENGFLLINAKYKIKKKYQPVTNLKLNIYEEISEDSVAYKGQVITDNSGSAKFIINTETVISDKVLVFKYLVRIEDDDKFKDIEKSESFYNVILIAEAIEKDSVHYISAKLTDGLGNPLEGEKLQVLLQRLFAPLSVGKSNYKTDSDGSIFVAIEDPLPGIDGMLTFEVVLDSRNYGNIKKIFNAPIGKLVTDQSTFEERTMWSPPSKTPLFLWIFPNIVILGIWIVIVVLISNLFKIYKSNKQTNKL